VPTSLARLFPGHPGLSWNVRLNLSTSADRSVLSMNWEQTNRFLLSFNDLICTAYSPNCACGKLVNNASQPVKSSDSQFVNVNYSPRFQVKDACGEQVLFVTFRKNLAHGNIDMYETANRAKSVFRPWLKNLFVPICFCESRQAISYHERIPQTLQ